MGAQHSLWMYIADAGLVVKCVMLILLVTSVTSWTFIFQRFNCLKQAKQSLQEFEDRFWSGVDLNEFYSSLKNAGYHDGLYSIFQSGFKEYLRLQKQGNLKAVEFNESVQRAMHIAYTREMDKLETHLPFLASAGSVSPYIGLFGTVWGIMTSLQALGSVQQATIAMVAPGISETLIVTAMGLFVAIPALLAYNRFSTSVERLLNQYEMFQDELTNLLQRQVANRYASIQ